MNIDITAIFSRAWKITWENKKGLWIFGILAALGSGGGGGGGGNNFNFRDGGGGFPSGGGGDFPNLPPNVERFLERLFNNEQGVLFSVGCLICVVLLLSLVVFALSLIGRGGLIGGARLAAEQGSVTFGEAWSQSTRNLGRLFILWLITGLLPIILSLAAAGILLAAVGAAVSSGGGAEVIGASVLGALACVVPLLCMLVPLGIALQILNHMGGFAAVLEDQSGFAALRRGWEVLKNNFITWVVLGAVLIVLEIIFGFVAALPIVIAVLPAIIGLGAGMARGSSELMGGGVIVALLCCAAYLPVLLILHGVFTTWATTAWTLTYEQLTRPPAPLVPGPEISPLAPA